jgi:inhibitor of cysteine peptidase
MKSFALFLFVSGFLLAGCASMPQTVVLSPHDSGHTITAAPGTIIEVRLPANPTTGYGWKPAEAPADVLTLVSSVYTPNSNPNGMAGVGGTEVFHFRASKTGQQTLQLNYARPWEQGVPPVKTVSFAVQVGQ